MPMDFDNDFDFWGQPLPSGETRREAPEKAFVESKGKRFVAKVLLTDHCIFLNETIALVEIAANLPPIWARFVSNVDKDSSK